MFEHVEFTLHRPQRDPFISTTVDIEVAWGRSENGYVYTLDSSQITKPIYDVAAEYEKECRTYGHADEKEFAVEHFIPWSAITKVQRKRDGEWKTLNMPTKRAHEFRDEDVFAE